MDKKTIELGGEAFEVRPMNYGTAKALNLAGINLANLDEQPDRLFDAMTILLDRVYPDEADQLRIEALSLNDAMKLFTSVMEASQAAESGN
ncbi:hypothetical protein [Pseudodesulfovibrio tunisiensis]|uniref:hypothetical protein n=1 Tax=Pseudodesulfovibrio tunisiensis TaxID=463192 RepID=UPI001FB3E421|nr:hypothetical protein [Pseudodesulfovibrio tunisiensis]